MRLENDNWSITGGCIVGNAHYNQKKNCQDALAIACNDSIVAGVVCDGCGGGDNAPGEDSHCEVAAHVLSQFIINKITELNSQIISVVMTNQHFVEKLYKDTCEFLLRTCKSTGLVEDELALYIKRYLLATINGFFVRNGQVVMFRAGDGVVATNNSLSGIHSAYDVTEIIDQQNTPKYLAYHCFSYLTLFSEGPPIPAEYIPNGFDIRTYPLEDVIRVMVATDGFETKDEARQSIMHNPEIPPTLQHLQWNKKGNYGLKIWMNRMSNFGFFEDDCAIVTAERKT